MAANLTGAGLAKAIILARRLGFSSGSEEGGGGSCTCTPSGPTLSDYSENLKGAWSFNDNGVSFLDSTANAYDLTPARTAWSFTQDGKRSYSAKSNGGYAYNSHADIAPKGVGAKFTLCVWINKTNNNSGHILGFAQDHTTDLVGFGCTSNSGNALYLRRNNANFDLSDNFVQYNNAWEHITMIRDDSAIRMLVNGVEVSSSSASGWDDDLDGYHLMFGRGGGGYVSSGTRYDGALYYDTDLSSTAIAELVNKGRGTFIDDQDDLTPPSGTALDTFADNCLQVWNFNDSASPITNGYFGGEKLDLAGGSGVLYEQTGKIGSAIQLSSDSWFETEFPPFTVVDTGDFSFSIWVNPASTGVLWSIAPDNTSSTNSMHLEWSSDVFTLRGLGTTARITSAASYSSGTWYLITVTRESGSVKLYVNKTEIGSSASFSSWNIRTYHLAIGRNTSTYAPNSLIDSAVAYDAALSIEAITELHDDLAVAA